MPRSRTGYNSFDRLSFNDIWLLWRTGELSDVDVGQFASERPDFRSWFSKRRMVVGQSLLEVDYHRGASAESLDTKLTSSGCRDK